MKALLDPYRVIIELVVLAVVVIGGWLFCEHLVSVGVQKQKAADSQETAKIKEAADKETGRLKGLAETASHIHDKELEDLRNYRAANPLHGGLCLSDEGHRGVPGAAATLGSNEGTSASAGHVQPVLTGDPGAGRPQDPDIRHLLDLLAGRGDELSAELREYQAREY